MPLPVSKFNFTPKSPFGHRGDCPDRTPLIWDRINRKIRCGLPNVVLIEGGGQTGKSTLGMMICEHYDKDFVIIYNTKELLDLMEKRVKLFESGDLTVLWKWIFFDEPQMEADKRKWADARNQVIGQITGGLYGELKQNMVLALPDIDDISSRLYRNITYRVVVDADFKAGKITRKANLYRPRKDLQKRGYKWTGAGTYIIPELKRREDYLGKKVSNMSDKLNIYRMDLDRQDRKKYKVEPTIPTMPTKERIEELKAIFEKKPIS
jgi:hypothetical protein